MKKLSVFDLDGTLAASKSAIDSEMQVLLAALLGVAKVAVISGGGFPQFQAQFLANLPKDERLANLSLLPTCGTRSISTTRRLKLPTPKTYRRRKGDDRIGV